MNKKYKEIVKQYIREKILEKSILTKYIRKMVKYIRKMEKYIRKMEKNCFSCNFWKKIKKKFLIILDYYI